MALSLEYSGTDRSPVSFRTFSTPVANRLVVLYRSWLSYRERRALESYPVEMMKDVGYPAVEPTDER